MMTYCYTRLLQQDLASASAQLHSLIHPHICGYACSDKLLNTASLQGSACHSKLTFLPVVSPRAATRSALRGLQFTGYVEKVSNQQATG